MLSNYYLFVLHKQQNKYNILYLIPGCFAKAFQRVPRSMSSSVASAAEMSSSITTLPDAQKSTLMYVFEVNLEIKEDDGRVSVLFYH